MATTMRSSLPDSSSDLSGDAKRDSILKSNEQAHLPIGKVGLFWFFNEFSGWPALSFVAELVKSFDSLGFSKVLMTSATKLATKSPQDTSQIA